MHKTQVFVHHEGDHFRTRLTHSLEVAQIARSIARALHLDEDLAEALALAHDIGHSPFGHAGEDALHACMEDYGGFDHNAYALRHVVELEQRYASFDGLNLTWETLEGIVKHNGPLMGEGAKHDSVADSITTFSATWDLELGTYASAEAQVAALSDDIAYNNHDLDDGLRAELFKFEDIETLPLISDLAREVRSAYPGIEGKRLRHETIRRLISHMIEDLLAETSRRIADLDPGSVDEVRGLGKPLIGFSKELQSTDKVLRAFLFENMYRHERVVGSVSKAQLIVRELFEGLFQDPDNLPETWRVACSGNGEPATARVVCDYIAGMTDHFARQEHERLFPGQS